MKIIDKLKKMNQYSIEYQEDVQEHICIAQQAFSASICMFFILHAFVIHMLDFTMCKRLCTALIISGIQMIFSFI